MEYFDPITDRTYSDVLTGREKGFFNISDWKRIVNNIRCVYAEIQRIHGEKILPLNSMAEMTINSIPTAENFRMLVENIRKLRDVAKFFPGNEMEIVGDFNDGGRSFDFLEVNEWEKMIDWIYSRYKPLEIVRIARTGVAGCGMGMTRGNRFKGV